MFHKRGVPELTIINFPEYPLAPADGELKHFSSITIRYIQPSNNILLNMLSASSDLSTIQYARKCRQVDGSGELTTKASDVIMKADKWPEKFDTVHGVDTGNDIFYLRNRTVSETLDEARGLEAGLFESHHVHSRMDQPNVGITSLAQGLIRVLTTKCILIILGKVNEKLNALVSTDSFAESVPRSS
ncbi:putative dynamin-related protein 4A [Platanthera guangdongensis]|uniref:Dynamin-related protein 4A n=1 Tax=Platanthera guangdongensis TaxID=2320717 RepID=A0ABR2N4T1_9ASPA